MYRLHNIGIEAKIDWLVKNGKLENKKLIISPWNEETMRMYYYLNNRWGYRGCGLGCGKGNHSRIFLEKDDVMI